MGSKHPPCNTLAVAHYPFFIILALLGYGALLYKNRLSVKSSGQRRSFLRLLPREYALHPYRKNSSKIF